MGRITTGVMPVTSSIAAPNRASNTVVLSMPWRVASAWIAGNIAADSNSASQYRSCSGPAVGGNRVGAIVRRDVSQYLSAASFCRRPAAEACHCACASGCIPATGSSSRAATSVINTAAPVASVARWLISTTMLAEPSAMPYQPHPHRPLRGEVHRCVAIPGVCCRDGRVRRFVVGVDDLQRDLAGGVHDLARPATPVEAQPRPHRLVAPHQVTEFVGDLLDRRLRRQRLDAAERDPRVLRDDRRPVLLRPHDRSASPEPGP